MILKHCKICKTTYSVRWWKCCPEHTTEQGPDIVCELCVWVLHPEGIGRGTV